MVWCGEGQGGQARGAVSGPADAAPPAAESKFLFLVVRGQGNIAVACMEVGTTEQSYYRWRKEYGDLNVDQAKRLKQLENEKGR